MSFAKATIKKLTLAQLQHVLDTYDKVVLSHGRHNADGGLYRALECVSPARSIKRKNNGTEEGALEMTRGMPDIRLLNDGPWPSDSARTKAMLPLIAALSDWANWGIKRKCRWAEIVAIETVKQLISALPLLSDDLRDLCRKAKTLTAAARATARAAAARAAAARAADATHAAIHAVANAIAAAATRAATRATAANADATAHATATHYAAYVAYATADADAADDTIAASHAIAAAAAAAARAVTYAIAADAAHAVTHYAAYAAYAAADAASYDADRDDAADAAHAVMLSAVTDVWLKAVKQSK